MIVIGVEIALTQASNVRKEIVLAVALSVDPLENYVIAILSVNPRTVSVESTCSNYKLKKIYLIAHSQVIKITYTSTERYC